MHGHCYTHESSEAKLLHSIYELTQRILHAEDRAYRDELRSVVQTLREQLIKLVQSIPVPTEIDVLEAKKAQSLMMGPRPPLIPMS